MLSHRVGDSSPLVDSTKKFFKVIIIIYTTPRSVQALLSVHIISNSWYCQAFRI